MKQLTKLLLTCAAFVAVFISCQKKDTTSENNGTGSYRQGCLDKRTGKSTVLRRWLATRERFYSKYSNQPIGDVAGRNI